MLISTNQKPNFPPNVPSKILIKFPLRRLRKRTSQLILKKLDFKGYNTAIQ